MVTQNTLRTHGGNLVFFENNFNFTAAFGLNKCFKQINLAVSLCISAPILSYVPIDPLLDGYVKENWSNLKFKAAFVLNKCFNLSFDWVEKE